MKKNYFIMAVLAALLFGGTLEAKVKEGDTIAVPRDYPTIQEAIDDAVSGVTILVDQGQYDENIAFINKSIVLRGSGSGNTIINGEGAAFPTISVQDSGRLILRDFTITGGTHGVYAKGNCHIEIYNSIIEDNSRDGVRVRLSSSAKLYNSLLTSNGENGLQVSYSSSAEAYQCTFSENLNTGIQVLGSSSAALEGNQINNNEKSGLGVTLGSEADLWSGNTISNNNQSDDGWAGVGIYHNSTVGIDTGNVIENNNGAGITAGMKSHLGLEGIVRDNEGDGILLSYDSSAIFGGASVTDNDGFGVHCQTDSKTIGMPATSGNTLGPDNGLCGVREPWREAVLSGSWYAHSDTTRFTKPEYFKDKQGIVHLRGVALNNNIDDSSDQLIFVLEEGYRPQFETRLNPVVNASGKTALRINPDGQVWVGGIFGEGTYVFFDGMYFFAAE